MPISNEERHRRREAVDNARHSNAMEGFEPAVEIFDAEEAFVRGELDFEEVQAIARRVCGLP